MQKGGWRVHAGTVLLASSVLQFFPAPAPSHFKVRTERGRKKIVEELGVEEAISGLWPGQAPKNVCA
jgi:hypothetical protein